MVKPKEARICVACGEAIRPLQMTTGLAVDDTGTPFRLTPDLEAQGGWRELFGHYDCIRRYLGAELTITAIEQKLLPLEDVNTLIDHRLPKFHTKFLEITGLAAAK